MPCLERAAGRSQHLGCLALGDPLDAQLTITFKQVSALEARPALAAILIAMVLFLVYRATRLPPLPKLYHVRSGGLRMTR